jgi:glyoxylase-like metal-dependent hydrolase (beta-lactamase superfamily II)
VNALEQAAGLRIHRYPTEHRGAFVNAYLVETRSSVVAVDSLLTVSESRALRGGVESIGKPLRAVLLTQSHPDHYGGLAELVAGDDVPIIAPQGVIDTIERDDEEKEQILRPMFGDEWAARRTFPNTPIRDGESVTVDDAVFTVIDLGPSESPHDSPWVLGADERIVFLGDQIYDHKHCYLADGFYEQWLANIETLRRRFPPDAALYVGHGDPVGVADWDWQRDYIETFVAAIANASWSSPTDAHAAVVSAMKAFLPTDELQFLMELSIEPVAAQLGLVPDPERRSP